MELKIENTSQELFQKAVKTLPIAPKRAEIIFLAEGIHRHISSYIDECLKKGIIPHSYATAKYDRYSRLFRVSEVNISGHLANIICGGKINQIRISSLDEEGFIMFRESYLKALGANGYQLEHGNLWLTYRTVGSHHEKGEIPLSELSFDRHDLIKGLELKLADEEHKNQLRKWFNSLKTIYR